MKKLIMLCALCVAFLPFGCTRVAKKVEKEFRPATVCHTSARRVYEDNNNGCYSTIYKKTCSDGTAPTYSARLLVGGKCDIHMLLLTTDEISTLTGFAWKDLAISSFVQEPDVFVYTPNKFYKCFSYVLTYTKNTNK